MILVIVDPRVFRDRGQPVRARIVARPNITIHLEPPPPFLHERVAILARATDLIRSTRSVKYLPTTNNRTRRLFHYTFLPRNILTFYSSGWKIGIRGSFRGLEKKRGGQAGI